jgi:hypothetical protein
MSRLRSRWGSRLIADPDPLDRLAEYSGVALPRLLARASLFATPKRLQRDSPRASTAARSEPSYSCILKGSGVLTARIDAIEQRASR